MRTVRTGTPNAGGMRQLNMAAHMKPDTAFALRLISPSPRPQRPLRIAQVAPLFKSIPPAGYGGTERVVSYLTEALVELGHQVTLFASGDSRSKARIIPVVERHLGLEACGSSAGLAAHTLQVERLADEAEYFDVVHFHTDVIHLPFAQNCAAASLSTLHGRLDLPQLEPLYRHFGEHPLVAISDSQRAQLPHANWCATVYHGLPKSMYAFQPDGQDHFLFLGRISPEKRLDRAIDIAVRSGTPLVIAASVNPADQEYFRSSIEPLLDHPLIQFIGEVGDDEKNGLLGRARALLMPIDWPEPFGLVMIEALACGTPVIAYGHGSVPEIIQHGVTGFVVQDQDQALAAAQEVGRLDRSRCRHAFEQRFTATTMALAYLSVYRELIGRRQRLEAPAATNGAGHVGEDPHW